MEPVTTFSSKTIVLPMTNIDTDQIIPARFLTTTSKVGLGQHCFSDWRRKPDGSLNHEFPFNDPKNTGASVLVAGKNFGCGSSREHAPWALRDAGIRAVISSQIADIFRGNAARNGVVPVVVTESEAAWLLARAGTSVTISVERMAVTADGFEAKFVLDPFVRHCLLHGVDELGYVMNHEAEIASFEEMHT